MENNEKSNVFSIFAKRLKEIRTERKITQAEFAEKIGVSVNALSHYETGKRIPTSDVLYNICLFLDVSADYLLGCSENSKIQNNDNIDITIEEVMNAIIVLSKLSCTEFKPHYVDFNSSIIDIEAYSIELSGSIINFISEYEKILDFMKNPEYPEYLKTGLKETLMSNFKAKYHIKNGRIRRNDFSDVDYEEILDDGEVPF